MMTPEAGIGYSHGAACPPRWAGSRKRSQEVPMIGVAGRIVAPLLVLGCTGLAMAADLEVPGQHPTLQAAVDAAAAGDVILCAPGTYAESVVAVKSGITISGRGATWDGGMDAAAGPCVQLTGDNNTVSGFQFV